MLERIQYLMQREQLTPAEFAAKIGIDRTSISHFISGRNQPSRVFIEKTLRTFPNLNARWFILGEGKPYSADALPSLFENNVTNVNQSSKNTKLPPTLPTINQMDKAEKKIEEIVVFNSDGTFGKYVEKNKEQI